LLISFISAHQSLPHRHAHEIRPRRYQHARLSQRADLSLCATGPANRQRAGVTHSPLGRCVLADYEGNDRLIRLQLPNQSRGLLLVAAPDLTNQDDTLGGGIVEKKSDTLRQSDAMHWISTNADGGRLAQPYGCRLRHDLTRQRSRARCDPYCAPARVHGGHDAELCLTWHENALRIWPDEARASPREPLAHADHIHHRHPLRHADDEPDTRVDGLDHRRRSVLRRHENQACRRASCVDCLGDCVEYGHVKMTLPAFPRRDTRHESHSVGHHSPHMIGCGPTSQTLANDACVSPREYGHHAAFRIASCTAVQAASHMSAVSTAGMP